MTEITSSVKTLAAVMAMSKDEFVSEIKKVMEKNAKESKSHYGFVRADGRKYSFLRPKELAEILRVSEKTLERWRAEGKGPPWTKISNKQICYAIADFDEWLAQNTAGGGPL